MKTNSVLFVHEYFYLKSNLKETLDFESRYFSIKNSHTDHFTDRSFVLIWKIAETLIKVSFV